MADSRAGATKMRPHFEEIQAHYDLSDEFFGMFQDPSRTYSCAFFESDDATLEEALEVGVDWRWETFAEYLDRLTSGVAVNAGFLCGHSALRRVVMGERSIETSLG